MVMEKALWAFVLLEMVFVVGLGVLMYNHLRRLECLLEIFQFELVTTDIAPFGWLQPFAFEPGLFIGFQKKAFPTVFTQPLSFVYGLFNLVALTWTSVSASAFD